MNIVPVLVSACRKLQSAFISVPQGCAEGNPGNLGNLVTFGLEPVEFVEAAKVTGACGVR
jgi:hypothetical protein